MRPDLVCPKCDKPVMGVYNEWNGSSDTHRREYIHYGDEDESMHCVETMPYREGLDRAAAESARPGDPMPKDW